MEATEESNEVTDNNLWQAYANETSIAALKLNFRHTSSSNCNLQCAKESLKSTNYKNQLPYPLSQNPEQCLTDTVRDLVNKKKKFQSKVDDITSMFKRCQLKLKVQRQFKCYHDMQEIMKIDPDEYFCSNYNWYYAGGNLQIQNVNDNEVLFHILNNKLVAAKTKRKPSYWKVSKKIDLTEPFLKEVFQLDSFHKNSVLLVSARQKHEVYLFDVYLDEENMSSKQIDLLSNEKPFVGHSINKNQGNEYTTIDATQTLNIWDIKTKKQKFSYKIAVDYDDLDNDYFAQITYRNDNTLAYINRTEFYLFDPRTNCQSNIYVKSRDLIASVDRFTNICPNKEQDSNIFLTSFRDILQMDIRYLSAVNKWCHTFDSAPLLSELVTVNGRNVYCVSSSKSTDKILIDDGNLPEYLPSCIKSFETSVSHNPYLNKQEDILSRLNFSTTGLQLYHKNDQIVLFSVNSAGDLFSQNIICGESENINVKKMNQKFKKWNDTIANWCGEKSNYEKIRVVDKVVLKDLKMQHKKQPIKECTNFQNEKISACLLSLKNFKKGLNSKITDVWFGTNDLNTTQLNSIEQLEPHVNVTNWLNQTSQISND